MLCPVADRCQWKTVTEAYWEDSLWLSDWVNPIGPFIPSSSRLWIIHLHPKWSVEISILSEWCNWLTMRVMCFVFDLWADQGRRWRGVERWKHVFWLVGCILKPENNREADRFLDLEHQGSDSASKGPLINNIAMSFIGARRGKLYYHRKRTREKVQCFKIDFKQIYKSNKQKRSKKIATAIKQIFTSTTSFCSQMLEPTCSRDIFKMSFKGYKTRNRIYNHTTLIRHARSLTAPMYHTLTITTQWLHIYW